MTHRERLTRKMEKREEWADKAAEKSRAAFATAHKIADAIPFGQPILVGHHSEKHHRADIARMDSNMGRGCERADMAAHHTSAAAGIADALESSIYDDDPDALEALTARIAEREAEREKMKTVNKLYRKADAAGLAALGIDLEALKKKLAEAGAYWGKAPHLPYELSNLSGRITADRKRLEYVKQRQQRAAAADAAPNGIDYQKCQGGYCRLTFAEKPDREILDALKTAGFSWGAGSWVGKADQLPANVAELVTAPAEPDDDDESNRMDECEPEPQDAPAEPTPQENGDGLDDDPDYSEPEPPETDEEVFTLAPTAAIPAQQLALFGAGSADEVQ